MDQVQAMAIGDRLRNAFQIGDFLSSLGDQIDFTLLDDIAAATREAKSVEGTEAKITAWLKVAKLTASATKQITVDDQVVAIAEQILTGPLKDLLVSIVDRLLAKPEAEVQAAWAADALTVEEQETFKAAGIDPLVVMQIIRLLLEFWNSRKAA